MNPNEPKDKSLESLESYFASKRKGKPFLKGHADVAELVDALASAESRVMFLRSSYF